MLVREIPCSCSVDSPCTLSGIAKCMSVCLTLWSRISEEKSKRFPRFWVACAIAKSALHWLRQTGKLAFSWGVCSKQVELLERSVVCWPTCFIKQLDAGHVCSYLQLQDAGRVSKVLRVLYCNNIIWLPKQLVKENGILWRSDGEK